MARAVAVTADVAAAGTVGLVIAAAADAGSAVVVGAALAAAVAAVGAAVPAGAAAAVGADVVDPAAASDSRTGQLDTGRGRPGHLVEKQHGAMQGDTQLHVFGLVTGTPGDQMKSCGAVDCAHLGEGCEDVAAWRGGTVRHAQVDWKRQVAGW